jgi:hypothetical protein
MSHFFKDKANRFYNKVAHEYIAKKLGFIVLIYKHSLENTPLNVYDEEVSKDGAIYFEKPIAANCLIQNEDQEFVDTDVVLNVGQRVTFGFQREYLKDINLVMEVGDIIEWNDTFYEVDTVVENRLIHSLPPYNFATVCVSHMTERSKLGFEEVRSGINEGL